MELIPGDIIALKMTTKKKSSYIFAIDEINLASAEIGTISP
jgi:hypothetical protein